MRRKCNKCGLTKDLTHYRESKTGYRRRVCNECMDEAAVKWQQDNRNRLLKWRKDYYQKNRAKQIAAASKWNKDHPVRFKEITTTRYQKLRDEAMAAYGGQICACCSQYENEPWFLCLDHVDNDQTKYEKELGRPHVGLFLVTWLKKNNYPEGFQVLCHCCNQAKHVFKGVCPHQLKKV